MSTVQVVKDRAVALSKDRAAKDRVAEKLVAAVNPRFSDYNLPYTLAVLVALAMVGAFVGLFGSNLACTEIVTSTSQMKSQLSNWYGLRVALATDATRPATLPSSVSWNVDICIVGAWHSRTTSFNMGWGSSARDVDESTFDACILFPPEWWASRSFPSYFDGCNYEDIPFPVQQVYSNALFPNLVPNVSTGNLMGHWQARYDQTRPGWRAPFACTDTSDVACGSSPAFLANATLIRDNAQAGVDYTWCGVDPRLVNWFDPNAYGGAPGAGTPVPRWEWDGAKCC